MKEHCRTDVPNTIAKIIVKKSMLFNQNFYYSLEANLQMLKVSSYIIVTIIISKTCFWRNTYHRNTNELICI